MAGGGVAGAESKEIRERDKGDKVEVGAISDKPHWGVLCAREALYGSGEDTS